MERYERQMKFQKFGAHSQETLQNTRILIMGAGALGSHVAELLARMGAHQLTIIDMDIVELSNLHRQALYDERDAQEMLPKVVALKRKIKQINHHVELNAIHQELTAQNIETIIQNVQPDIVIDGMDQFDMRFLINEVCHKLNIPWIYGAAVGSKGTVYAIDYSGPCLRCILQSVPQTGESCAINGVLPPVVQQVASYEVSELLRYVAGKSFSKKLITIDTFDMNIRATNINLLKDNDCVVCEQGIYQALNTPPLSSIEALCGDTFLFRFKQHAFELAHHFPGHIAKENAYVKFIAYEDITMTLFKDGRMNVRGIESQETAEDIYQQFNRCIK
ncbi:ThiF family adenylyltransferase [Mammaliicoccus sciuri]|uniref:ThiF family adenylyltransferase n=1 Tax=Mammaliicoccus sciuri TaxID=1296 RepID=UPI00265C2823|nr:ThiF family adenylyltransferase [Mammaliicoccus sciuri]MDO0957841.1 ThiF family adenylyltransferase [Mammaliicoccus sciuri]